MISIVYTQCHIDAHAMQYHVNCGDIYSKIKCQRYIYYACPGSLLCDDDELTLIPCNYSIY